MGKKKYKKKKELQLQLSTLKKDITACEYDILRFRKEIRNANSLQFQIEKMRKEKESIEDAFLRARMIDQIEAKEKELVRLDRGALQGILHKMKGKLEKLCMQKTELLRKISERRAKMPAEKTTKLGKPSNSTEKPKGTRSKGTASSKGTTPAIESPNSLSFVDVPWDNVSFHDGSISIIWRAVRFDKAIKESKSLLNEIKAYYNFKNVPRLNVKLANRIIVEIQNEEVLFYHLKYLSVIGYNFGSTYVKQDVNIWNGYSKEYYKRNLSFLFPSRSLRKLCNICDEQLPIVPAGEVVLNSDGHQTIHNSFLFPLKSSKGYLVVWESVEGAKASYIFTLKPPHLECLQVIYDYIAGGSINKRKTLIRSKKLQQVLSLETRVFHTSEEEWGRHIERLRR